MKGTIKPTDEITALFNAGQRVHTDNIMALIQKSCNKRGSSGRVAFIAGKRLGNAPVRNKAKRRMREAAHRLQAPWWGYDVVFVAKKRVVEAGFEGVLRDMERIRQELSEAGERLF